MAQCVQYDQASFMAETTWWCSLMMHGPFVMLKLPWSCTLKSRWSFNCLHACARTHTTLFSKILPQPSELWRINLSEFWWQHYSICLFHISYIYYLSTQKSNLWLKFRGSCAGWPEHTFNPTTTWQAQLQIACHNVMRCPSQSGTLWYYKNELLHAWVPANISETWAPLHLEVLSCDSDFKIHIHGP